VLFAPSVKLIDSPPWKHGDHGENYERDECPDDLHGCPLELAEQLVQEVSERLSLSTIQVDRMADFGIQAFPILRESQVEVQQLALQWSIRLLDGQEGCKLSILVRFK